jgi:hypothetical protein
MSTLLEETCFNFDVATSKTRWSSAVGATDVFVPKREASQLPESCKRVSMAVIRLLF